jgi:hypothetical protein
MDSGAGAWQHGQLQPDRPGQHPRDTWAGEETAKGGDRTNTYSYLRRNAARSDSVANVEEKGCKKERRKYLYMSMFTMLKTADL